MGKVNKILKIVKTDEYYSCNICAKRCNEEVEGEYATDSMHEISFGMDNHSTTVHVCTECLNEFSDVLWRYLEHLERVERGTEEN